MVKNGEDLVLRIHHVNGVRWKWKGGGGGGGGGGQISININIGQTKLCRASGVELIQK